MSKLQPLDAGIIAAMRVRYRRRQMEHAVDLLDTNAFDLYKSNILISMRQLSKIWKEWSIDTIRNCWGTTGIVSGDDCVDYLEQSDCAQDDIPTVEQYVQMAVPTAARRTAVPEILSWEHEMKCTQAFSEEDIVSNIVSAGDIVADDEEHEDENDGTHNLGTIGEQLASVAHVKTICTSVVVERDALIPGLRELQDHLWKQRRNTMPQRTTDPIFCSTAVHK